MSGSDSGPEPERRTTAHIGWPFAVARNRSLDWRSILAPAWLVGSGSDYSLVRTTAGPVSSGLVMRPSTDDVNRFTIVFRRLDATPQFLGDTDAEPRRLLDRFGRPVSLVEGLIVPGHGMTLDEEAFAPTMEAVHRLAVETFRAFWSATDEAAPPRTAGAMELGPGDGVVVSSR